MSESNESQNPLDFDLRTRIATVIARMNDCWCEDCHPEPDEFDLMVADAVLRELPELTALRRCGRCRIPCLPDEYPPMSEGSNELRPFCIRCTKYIEWATS